MLIRGPTAHAVGFILPPPSEAGGPCGLKRFHGNLIMRHARRGGVVPPQSKGSRMVSCGMAREVAGEPNARRAWRNKAHGGASPGRGTVGTRATTKPQPPNGGGGPSGRVGEGPIVLDPWPPKPLAKAARSRPRSRPRIAAGAEDDFCSPEVIALPELGRALRSFTFPGRKLSRGIFFVIMGDCVEGGRVKRPKGVTE